MRKVLILALLVPVFALAAGKLQPITTIAPDDGVAGVPPAQLDNSNRQSPTAPMMILGTLDTIGGTTYDWWTNGSQWQMMAYAPEVGVHVLWMYSAELSGTTFPDRNMRYNFYDFAANEWNWIDPDWMQSGVNVFGVRVGYGNLDADPTSGVAVVSAHGGNPIHVLTARDIAPGAGIFEYADGTPTTDGYQWPPLSIGSDGTIHIFPITAAYLLAHTSISTWPDYTPIVNVFDPSPGFPTHNIVASKNSQKVATVWEYSTDDYAAYHAVSEDGGATWGTPVQMTPPEAFGPDTTSTFHIAGMNLFYDMNDQLHILASVTPEVAGQGYTIPATIWHWCSSNSPEWSKIHDYRADTLNAPVGYNATFATRPSMTEDPDDGRLYVVWEQFDSLNYEPTTNFARADIHASGSSDNGATWTPEVRLTDAGAVSCRFPSCAPMIVAGELWVMYELDQTAGFFVQSEHPGENNPVVMQRVPVELIGIAEGSGGVPVRAELGVTPNPVRNRALISYALPQAANVSLVVYDATGRPVQNVVSGYRAAGRHTATLDAGKLSAGVYFYTLTAGRNTVSRKLTVTN